MKYREFASAQRVSFCVAEILRASALEHEICARVKRLKLFFSQALIYVLELQLIFYYCGFTTLSIV